MSSAEVVRFCDQRREFIATVLDYNLSCAFSDAQIVGGTEDSAVPVNSLVLASWSPILCDTLHDIDASCESVIVLCGGFAAATVRDLVTLMYSGSLSRSHDHGAELRHLLRQLGVDGGDGSGGKLHLLNTATTFTATSTAAGKDLSTKRRQSDSGGAMCQSDARKHTTHSQKQFDSANKNDRQPNARRMSSTPSQQGGGATLPDLNGHLSSSELDSYLGGCDAKSTPVVKVECDVDVFDGTLSEGDDNSDHNNEWSNGPMHFLSPQTSKSLADRDNISKEKPPRKKYKCKICAKVYIRKQALVTHKKLHKIKSRTDAGDGDRSATFNANETVTDDTVAEQNGANHSAEERQGDEDGGDCQSELNNGAQVNGTAELKSFICRFCNQIFPERLLLRAHLHIMHPLPPEGKHRQWSCAICSEIFTDKRGLNQHLSSAHPGEAIFQCDVENCRASFKDRKSFRAHRESHEDQWHACDKCQKRFRERRTLENHACVEPKDRPYSCPICKKGYFNKSYLKAHSKLHTGEKLFQCGLCPKQFCTESNLRLHTLIHSGKKGFVCDICGKGFTYEGNLKDHISTHTGEKHFQCSVCGGKFNRNSQLKKHMRGHTGERPYLCDFCGKGFMTNGCLQRHKIRHAEVRQFVCDVCAKGFTSGQMLKDHRRIHTGEKPYPCEVCHKFFRTSDLLSHHRKTHKRRGEIAQGRKVKETNATRFHAEYMAAAAAAHAVAEASNGGDGGDLVNGAGGDLDSMITPKLEVGSGFGVADLGGVTPKLDLASAAASCGLDMSASNMNAAAAAALMNAAIPYLGSVHASAAAASLSSAELAQCD